VIEREQVSAAVTVLRLDHGPVSAMDLEWATGKRARRADAKMTETWKSPEAAGAIAAYVERTLGRRG
jgi:hypothetical protein